MPGLRRQYGAATFHGDEASGPPEKLQSMNHEFNGKLKALASNIPRTGIIYRNSLLQNQKIGSIRSWSLSFVIYYTTSFVLYGRSFVVYRMSFVVPRYRFPSYYSCSCYIYGSDFSSYLGQCQSSFLRPNNYRAMALLGRLSVPSGDNVTNACSSVQSESRTEPDECHTLSNSPLSLLWLLVFAALV